MNDTNITFGITQEFPCSYLADRQEKLIVALDERIQNLEGYSWLMANGFRRSGGQLYRPKCSFCNACQSIRVIVDEFKPTKSQKRLLKKNDGYTVKVSNEVTALYYPLFEIYINTLHTDGSMYPASQEQFNSFLKSDLSQQCFVELWHHDNLISVAVTDILPNALSAVYTFYHPDYRKYSIGMYSILRQIKHTQSVGKSFLYLGYQIDECQKMNYKTKFAPYQRFIENNWQTVK